MNTRNDYDNTNRGVLFKNEKKESDKQPDYTGNLNVDGVELQLSAWVKTSSAGKKFFSLSVRPKQEQHQGQGYLGQNKKKRDQMDDEIPF